MELNKRICAVRLEFESNVLDYFRVGGEKKT